MVTKLQVFHTALLAVDYVKAEVKMCAAYAADEICVSSAKRTPLAQTAVGTFGSHLHGSVSVRLHTWDDLCSN
ncbi:unnamed protein product [Dibothriocephalus latus]|uniref:Uncharacterized protein n=1 Tax=Dibothriocephalus latus TaxID=60516 RepID=A0A3P7P9A5_DIBLA|nr:unnamed protein product [Dibothriocephalus latus]